MLPGVVLPSSGLPDMKRGACCAVTVVGNRYEQALNLNSCLQIINTQKTIWIQKKLDLQNLQKYVCVGVIELVIIVGIDV